jgi:hypothetical protein
MNPASNPNLNLNPKSEKEKYIRTINNKLKLKDLKGGFVLPYEHLIQNITEYILKKE